MRRAHRYFCDNPEALKAVVTLFCFRLLPWRELAFSAARTGRADRRLSELRGESGAVRHLAPAAWYRSHRSILLDGALRRRIVIAADFSGTADDGVHRLGRAHGHGSVVARE